MYIVIPRAHRLSKGEEGMHPCTRQNSNHALNILYTKYTAIAREITKYSNILLPRLNFAVVRACMCVACPLFLGSLCALGNTWMVAMLKGGGCGQFSRGGRISTDET